MPLRPLLSLVALAFLLLAPLTSSAQRVTGLVTDAEAAVPLPSATVALWQIADGDSTLVTGAMTDPDGVFVIDNVSAGTYDVLVSFVGYENWWQPGVTVARGTTDLGMLALTPTVAAATGVTVTAERRRVEVQFDRTVYTTDDSPVTVGGNATDVLATLPSVNVDVDGNVSLRGSGSVRVLINGSPAPVGPELLASYLSQLPAAAIERVEVIPNPSARYDPEGVGGVLNLVLKQEADTGLTGTVATGVTSQGGVEGTGSLVYGAGPWTLRFTYGIETENNDAGGGTSFRIDRSVSGVASDSTILDQIETENEDEFSQFASATIGYALTERTRLSLAGQVSTRNDTEIEANTYDELVYGTSAQGGARAFDYERIVDENDLGWDADARLTLDHDFSSAARVLDGGRLGGRGVEHALRVEARYAFSTNKETVGAIVRGVPRDGIDPQDVNEDRDRAEASFSLDYVRPLLGGRFEAGARADLETIVQDLVARTEGILDTNESNAFDFDERIWAAYLQGAREVGPLDVQVGVRGEIAQTTFDLVTTGETNDRRYASLFPSAFLGLAVTDNDEVKLSYSRRIERPNTWRINPFFSYDDPLNRRRGNPALEPEYIDAVEAGYVRYTTWGSLTANAFYRRTTNAIQRVQARCVSADQPLCAGLSDEVLAAGQTAVRSFENRDATSATGLEAIFSVEDVLGGLGGYVSLEGFQVNTEGASTGDGLAEDGFGWGSRANLTYDLPRVLLGAAPTLQVNLFYRAPMESENGRRGARTWFDAALQQRLLDDRASLTLRLRDPLNLAGFNYTIDRADQFQRLERRWGAQQIGLTFRYAFGQALEDERGGRGGGGNE
ncbi:MAG: TonB-dependent receptor [Bacteroidota bacterium]